METVYVKRPEGQDPMEEEDMTISQKIRGRSTNPSEPPMRFRDSALFHKNNPRRVRAHAYIPPPLRKGHIPGWLRRRLVAHSGMPHPWSNPWVTLEDLAQCPRRWLDHCGSTFYDGQEYFVSEPYSLTEESLRSIAAFCDRLELEVMIHAASAHYPTQTLRLMFTPRRAAGAHGFRGQADSTTGPELYRTIAKS